jgi:hypothetical protein
MPVKTGIQVRFRFKFRLDSGVRPNDGYRSRLPVANSETLHLEPRIVQSVSTPGYRYLDSFNSLTALRAKVKSATSEDETSRDDFNVSLELAINSCIASSETTPVSE